jgi:hypothetical protein
MSPRIRPVRARLRAARNALFVAALLLACSGDADAQQPVQLWSDAGGAARIGSDDGRIIRGRTVRIEARVATGTELEPGTQVELPLFVDLVVQGTVTDRADRGRDSRSVKGQIEGPVGGRFFLSSDGEAVVGNVIFDDGRAFRIRPDRNGGGSLIREIDTQSNPGCQNDETQIRRDRQEPPEDGAYRRVDDGSLVDVYLMYTSAARDSIGGTAAMRAWLQLAIDVSNDAYELSEVNHRLRLVGRSETTWNETATTTTLQALGWLQADNDNILDEAHTLRDDNGADIVGLIFVASDPCGRGYVGGTTDDTDGFNVDHWNCIDAAGGWTLVHEIGHNLGSGHDVASPDGPLFAYGIGHQFVGSSRTTWQTIMVRRAMGGTRIGYFSNPNVNFDGVATGVPTGQTGAAHNQLAYANVDQISANWRESLPSTVYVDFSWAGSETGSAANPFNTIGEAVSQVVFGGNVIVIGGGTSTEPLTLGSVKALTLRWGP